MEKTLIVDDVTARKIYPNAAPELKAIFEQSFPPGFFTHKITDRIKTFEDACEYNNTNPKASRFVNGTKNQIYQERVAEITKALNEGWEPNYDDQSEYKYTPWFYLNKPGFRFGDSGCSYAYAHAGAGSRFAFKSDELSTYAGKQFLSEYEGWMSPLKSASVCAGLSSNGQARQKFTGDVKAWEEYIIPKIKTFGDACAETYEDPYNPKFNEGTPDEIAYKKYKVVCQALNGGWVCDWKDGNQRKWYPWMEYNSAAAGFRFFDSFYSYAYALSGSGSRLRLCSEAIAKHAGTQFAELLSEFLM